MKRNSSISNRKSNVIKWAIIIAIFALVCALVGMFVKIDRRTTPDDHISVDTADERLGAEMYSIGTISDTGEIDNTVKTSIYTRDLIVYEDITKIDLLDNIDLDIAYYDKSGNFIIKEDYSFSLLTLSDSSEESMYSCRMILTPYNDSEITLSEVSKYANMLEVRIKK